ncbi:uncharacterized protein LOC110623612 isoform X2 [Manihot esculenta]|uniref:uncharacterized protein LOC110623612 isoform X2 n=1 Tax=Manihot esculenta TaxID=3983 RepID=UPI000B5D4042|nr:uncharacterized protein LOC110623612 isoform X2 [Manihot esculenta]
MHRVKVYRLNEDGKWDDQGTGHVTVDHLEKSDDLGLFVIDEDDNETLLLHRIMPDDIYRKQEDTIISWRDPEYSIELALSFQETAGCSYIWDHICNVQRSLQFSPIERIMGPPVHVVKCIAETGAEEKLQVESNSMHMVKVYRLNEDGKWDNQGTGHVTVDHLEGSDELGLFVIDEDETLLLHRIVPGDIYRKQEDTIISWRDPEYSTELALSFQETTGCSYIWDNICTVQRNLQFSTPKKMLGHLLQVVRHGADMGAKERAQVESNSMHRVKVYRLNEDGKWDDQGTGHVTIDHLEGSDELGLFVIDEDDNETLLLHRILPDGIYRKQEDTIISWRDPEYFTELALSFQETAGCSYIWDHVCNVQRNLQYSTIKRMLGPPVQVGKCGAEMGTEEKSQVESNSMHGVKVYRLNDDGKWDDQGTGHVTVDCLEGSDDLGLFVIDENDNETLLIHRIMPDDIYRKQEDTIISWRDPVCSAELALSFQETTGCSHIWYNICNVHRSLQFSTIEKRTSRGSLSANTQYSCNMWHNHKDVSIGSREFSGNSLNLQYLEPRSYGRNYASDEEETVSMPVFPSKKSLTTEVSDGWKSKRSKTEFTYSSTSSESEVNFATFDSTFLFTLSKDEERKQNFK